MSDPPDLAFLQRYCRKTSKAFPGHTEAVASQSGAPVGATLPAGGRRGQPRAARHGFSRLRKRFGTTGYEP
jgi:hypothetical protein